MSPFKETISYALAMACKAHRNCAEAALNEAAGVHTGQEMILVELWQAEGLTQSQLVAALAVEPPTVTKMLQRLERCGLVERQPDAEDARVVRVFLTPQGRLIQAAVERSWQALEARTTAGMTAEERMLLRRLLLQAQVNLQGAP